MNLELIREKAFGLTERMALAYGMIFTLLILIIRAMIDSKWLDALIHMQASIGAVFLEMLIMLRLIDHVTGMMAAQKLHKKDPKNNLPVTSRTFLELTLTKACMYAVFIAIGFWAQTNFNIGYGLLYAFSTCLFSECFSITENLANLELTPAKWFLKILKTWIDFVGEKFKAKK